MSVAESVLDISKAWHECASWLIRCGALREDHRANWPSATAADLALILRDGVLLCNLLNTIEPECIDMKDINQKPQMAQFLCLRNIKAFLTACSTTFGLSESDLFEPSMLFDLSNFHRVLCTLSALSNSAKFRKKGIKGFSIRRGRSQEDMFKDLQSTGIGPTEAVVASFTIKPRQVDLGDPVIYQELLLPTTPQQEGPFAEEVLVVPRTRWRENEGRRRRFRRREGEERHEGEAHEDSDGEDNGYAASCSHARSEEVYHDLCNLHLPPPPSAVQGATPERQKRDYVVQELLETERNYSEVLNDLLRFFARPLSQLLRPEEAARIFFKIKELADIHVAFHSQLRKARSGAALGQAFLDWREKFLIYGDYCANLTNAQNILHDCCTKSEMINQEVMKCQQKANDGKFKLRDILSVPMQRVLKYHLLLDKLIEETPNAREWEEDQRILTKAYEVMVDVAQYINEVKRDSDTLEIIRDIKACIVGWDISGDNPLEDFGRLLKDGELKVKAHDDHRVKARYAFVFDRCILVCKSGRNEQYYYRETLKLEDYRLEDHTGRRTLGRDSRWSYQWLLVHKQALTAYTLYARNEEQKQIWIKALQEAMDNVNPAACRNTDHKFRLNTFETPCSCEYCGKFLKGRIYQGYRCEVCRLAVHKQCISYSGRCSKPPPPPPPPTPPLPCERALSSKLWFVGEMGRDTAALKLETRDNGTYMLRIRPAGHPRLKYETNYALSIKADGAVRHIRVFKREADGTEVFYLSESRFFKSVVELVEYYERHSLTENFEKLDQRLLWPFRRVIAKALFDFRGSERNQLHLRRGSCIVVLSKEGDATGWWKGKIGEMVGFFPKEYVEEVKTYN